MTLFKRPWFLVLLIIAGIYTYQFYNRVEVGTSSAQATSQTEDPAPTDDKPPISIKISQEFAAQTSKNFELSSDFNMSVKFVKTDGSKIIVSLIGEGDGYKNDGQRLADWFEVSSTQQGLKFSSFEKKQYKNLSAMKELAKRLEGVDRKVNFTMIIEYPEDYKFETIQLQSVTSDVYAESLAFNKFHMTTVSGNLRLKKSAGRELKIESVSGDSNVEISGLQKAEVASVSGNAVIQSDQTNPAVAFDSVSGDLKLRIPENSQVDVSFNSMTGDLINDFGNSPSAPHKLKFSSLSGSATINKLK